MFTTIGDRIKGRMHQEESDKPKSVQEDDTKISKALEDALWEKALQDYDYLKFMESSKALEAFIPDESVRLKATFATLQVLGLTKDKLLDTAKHYLAVLAAEQQAFHFEVEKQAKELLDAQLALDKRKEEFEIVMQKIKTRIEQDVQKIARHI